MTERQKAKVFVVDSDFEIRHRLQVLLMMANFDVKIFVSAADFLADHHLKEGCLIIDVRSGINWLGFQMELAKQRDDHLVVLVINGRADIPMVIGAMSASAVDFIEKPFDGEQIVASIRRALDIHSNHYDRSAKVNAARARIATLTPRQRGVAEKLVIGKPNKIVAHELGISPRTVETHRAHIMEKLELSSISDLVLLMHAAHRTDWQRLAKQG